MIALVMDDERDQRDLMREALEAAGWRVEIAEDGIAALGRVPRVCPDVVLLDLRMPNLDGAGMLKMLRSTPAGRGVRVVLTTAAEVGQEIESLADAVLTKPFDARALLEVVGHPRSPARRGQRIGHVE